MQTATLLIQCDDKPGIVANISEWVFVHRGNIVRSDQYSSDPSQGVFFMRVEFHYNEAEFSFATLQAQFEKVAKKLEAKWSLHDQAKKTSVAILVSQQDHCLHDLLYHWKSDEMPMDVTCIISNHKNCETLAKQYEIPFHYLPIDAASKIHQENEILKLTKDKADFLILARYMQILSENFLQNYGRDVINIHHSFLPSFVGANPYKQAYDRGVKLIGATAHYVTPQLDEGPIIAQTVAHVSVHDDVSALRRKGKNLEKAALLHAVQSHIEKRVIRFGNKTIVFA